MTKHLQKFTAILLAAIMTLGVFTVVPFTASATTSGDFEYWVLDDGTAEIIVYTGIVSELTIPSTIDGYKVTSIGYEAFSWNDKITKITVPNSVTSIGDWAFRYCDNLATITIPDSVTSIGDYAFYRCKSLTNINVNNNNEHYSSINGVLFNKNKSELITYPAGKTDENYIIPNSVTSIGNYAFYYCRNLSSITIPDSVTTIDRISERFLEIDDFIVLFEGCTNLININVNNNNEHYSSINGVLFNKNKSELITYPVGKIDENYTIPDSVTSIGNYAFYYCRNLSSITIPDSVTSIGDYAFLNCTSLTSITIPDSVTSIGDYAFLNCTSLTSITIPDSVTSIGEWTFRECTGLTSITIPASVTSIGYSAFDGCTSLTSITIPDSVTSIGYSAFDGCTSLTSITIPDSVTSIGKWAFASCKNLSNISIPDSVTSIGDGAFYDTAWFNNQPDGIVYAGKIAYTYKGKMPKNTSLTIKDGTKSIADEAFWGCTGLTSITIPDSVTSIGVDSFNKCTNLKSITIPNSMTSIGEWTFRECTGLTSITIPDSVTSINERAFDGCTRLTSITVNNSNANYSSVDGVLFNKNKTELIKYLEGKTDENYTIPDSVTSIGKWAFASCRRIKSLTIPTSVTSIGEWAFNNCGINSITIPASVTSIYGTDLGFFDGVILVDTLTITGYKGTAAEKYANEYGFKFIALDDSANSTNPTEPTESTEPTVPTVPNQPTVPTVPTVPTEPTEPTNPIQPTEPNNPDDPANPTPDNTSKPSLGDIDGDGKISVNDVTDIQKYIVQLKPFTDEQMKFADVDKNGKIDVNDVTLLQKVIVKIAVI